MDAPEFRSLTSADQAALQLQRPIQQRTIAAHPGGIPLENPASAAIDGFELGRTEALRLESEGKNLEDVSRTFEELLASMLVKEMRKNSGVELFGSGAGCQVLEGMFDRFLAESMTQGRGLGVGENYAARIIEDAEHRAAARGEEESK